MSAWAKSTAPSRMPHPPSRAVAARTQNLSGAAAAKLITGNTRDGNGLTISASGNPASRIDAVIASATASVAEVCDNQVGQVRSALSHACESEVRQLKAVLSDACAGETEKVRDALTTACDRELRRVSTSLAKACAREVESVSASCQSEVERVKSALKQACEQEVAAVRDSCRNEVEHVKVALREACEAEVRSVRDACQEEIKKVRVSLAEACQQEVAAMVSSIEHDVALARAKQRKELELAAEPYVRAVQSAHTLATNQIDQLHAQQQSDSRKLRELESQALRNSQQLAHMTAEVSARDRMVNLDVSLRHGGRFLVLRVARQEGGLASLLGSQPKLRVNAHTIRLGRDGESLLLWPWPPPQQHRKDAPAAQRLLLSDFSSVSLGGPGWCCRAAAFDVQTLKGAAWVSEREEQEEHSETGRNGEAVGGGSVLRGEGRQTPPRWRLLTLTPREGAPYFLCASSEAQAMAWATGLAPLLPQEPVQSYGALLWRRVRLRLDAKATDRATQLRDGAVGSDDGEAAGSATRLGVLSRMLYSMAAEEEARKAWVRYHLSAGDHEGAKRMGWSPHVDDDPRQSLSLHAGIMAQRDHSYMHS